MLTLHKDTLHIDWPFGVKENITITEDEQVSKDGLARSPDRALSPKNRFFDLDRFINIESKEFYSKS